MVSKLIGIKSAALRLIRPTTAGFSLLSFEIHADAFIHPYAGISPMPVIRLSIRFIFILSTYKSSAELEGRAVFYLTRVLA